MLGHAAALAAALALSACDAAQNSGTATAAADAPIAPILATPDAVDPHSYARPLEASVTRVALDLAVDFTNRRTSGR